ncbi:ethanolamine-phosphate cytidylyltransferase-like [Salvia splendens]|uniref:ethanolamine-phosphate cytidylyltransferase-like n=1 Tax=Salvia splendens TaxID=180675 RepID=UPI001C27E4E0|nr:ethanolamine-phosphate cytidylyltransferase-like [Salvia splendens]XP_042055397.1 ethanolamine-phosphate cytidylyltransferase-like [Salvia splendens]XP_042055398.1 ethanolamine-phosphate cytidylyltransferase-like [Salvia splendens]XP_042055399.1 ethanolamine-phosphate cytidylyltransferase-like [Salvia splendens]XP_042055400.1 ethanolamine-phosphate cytidylyltransferase-like [Salvia splendens]XP_042055401.1 ethanolamine-phosphate cytidylyltransferase-like [Salvia splendens]
MEFESSSWIRDGVCFYPHLFGGIMITCALLSFSTSYFGMIGVPPMPHLFPDLRVFHKKKSAKKRVRVYMDGCFDLMHYGHANALRQAKALGDELVVGVVSDEEIIANKGPPVLSMEERLALVSGLKWVDEVIPNAPYEITEEFMHRIFKEHKIDYIIHGDDPCLLPDGTDAYALAKKAGRYKQIKRTEGVSSTDIVGRILSWVKEANAKKPCSELPKTDESESVNRNTNNKVQVKGAQVSSFLPTSRRIVQFSNDKVPGPNSRVVYIDGAFDLFHAGHVEILKSARALGDFLLVGVYPDQTVSELRGSRYPLMNLHERSLSVLACRYVDEVIIGAPWEVTKDVITTFNISLVVHGTVAEKNPFLNGKPDPYSVPKSMGIFQTLESPKDITTTSITERIIANHEIYLERNAKKEASEKKYYEEKTFVAAD